MTTPPDAAAAAAILHDLLAWFDAHGRDLPWRRRRTLYGTWISEMMLQQTTVKAVVPYFERFLARFPTVQDLGAATQQEVLELWSGLGYYRRARQLHAAAQEVMASPGGRLPTSRDAWLALPGVGPYAAGAIASQGLGEAVPAVDANARRVLLRWTTADPGVAASVGAAELERLAASLVPPVRPGDWNEAVMELGARVCRAREPLCNGCPVREACRAGRAGTADLVPPPVARRAPTPVDVTALVVHDRDRVLIVPAGSRPLLVPATWGPPAREDLGSLHRGLWGPPTSAWFVPGGMATPNTAWRDWLTASTGADPVVALAGTFRHAITRWRLRVQVTTAPLDEKALDALARNLGGRAAALRDGPPLSRLATKILEVSDWQSVDR